ncbi:MAG: hypothetical protein U0228_11270 [Myxococcaceae bacterium]
MRATWLVAVVVAASSCATVVPMQTASAVAAGRVRLGAQLGTAGFCGDLSAGGLGVLSCAEMPDGVPLPELRAGGRFGFGHGVDLGVSVFGMGTLFAPEKVLTLGATADVKGELFRIPTSLGTHIVSAGVVQGLSGAGRLGLPWWTQIDLGVPVFYGLQFERIELVVGASFVQRMTTSPGPTGTFGGQRVGFTLGLFTRNPSWVAVQVGYFTDPAKFNTGAIQLQVGYFFDVRPQS